MADALLSFEVSRKDTERFAEVMQRAQDELGITPKNAITWAGYFVSQSLGAASLKAPKLRKIVANPHPNAKTDGRRAKFGVMKYTPEGIEYFQPIYRTGEFGKIRFQDKKTAVWLVRDRITGEVKKEQWTTGTGEFDMAGIAQSPKRKIGRSGLLKASWKAVGKMTRKGGSASFMGAQDAVNVKWTGQRFAPTLTLANNLRYAAFALKHGDNGVEHVMEKAANSMANRINDRLEKALQS